MESLTLGVRSAALGLRDDLCIQARERHGSQEYENENPYTVHG
jgi:hypothetical protein